MKKILREITDFIENIQNYELEPEMEYFRKKFFKALGILALLAYLIKQGYKLIKQKRFLIRENFY